MGWIRKLSEETPRTPPTQPPLLVPPEFFFEVKSLVESEFTIQDGYMKLGVPTFVVASIDAKEPFKRLVLKMREKGYIPFLRREEKQLIIRVVLKPLATKPSGIRFNILLFLITLGTVFYAGYLLGLDYSLVLKELGMPQVNSLTIALLYAASAFGIIALHELGHKIAANKNGIESTLPYFIPGPYPYGTFGAIIMQKEPPINRDQLFDLGSSGPLVGFLVTVIVAIVGIQLSPVGPEIQGTVSWPTPLLFDVIMIMTRPVPHGFTLYIHPVAFAAWFGFVLTFLNLMPAWQLDGGHIARAVLGPQGHSASSFIGAIILILTNWWLMGILVLFLSSRGRHPGPLDDVSPLSKSRNAIAVVIVLVIALSLVSAPLFS